MKRCFETRWSGHATSPSARNSGVRRFLGGAKAPPNNYRIDRVSGDPSVIARSPCDEAIQGPRAVAPGLLTWGFSRQWLISVFHVVGFLMWRGRGLDGQRAPSSSWKPVFPAARGCQGAKLAGSDAHGTPLADPSRRQTHQHESEGAAAGRRW